MKLEGWFKIGMTFERYVESMQVNRQELQGIYDQLEFTSEDLSVFHSLSEQQLRGVVLTADWCGDAALCVPVIQKIAEHAQIELRYLIRDENLELMDQYLTNGTSRAIPIFIFINESGEEVNVWGPRSTEVQAYITALRADLPAADAPDFKDKQQQMFRQFKEKITTDPSIWRTVIDSVKAKLI